MAVFSIKLPGCDDTWLLAFAGADEEDQQVITHVCRQQRGGLQDKKIKVVWSAKGPIVPRWPLGNQLGTFRNVPAKNLLAYAVRDRLQGGDALTSDWLLGKANQHTEVQVRDGNAARVVPDNLQVVSRSLLDAPQPPLPRICFARSLAGNTICGAPTQWEGSRVCLAHKDAEEAASEGHRMAQLHVFRLWLQRHKRDTDPEVTAAHAQHDATTSQQQLGCRACLQAVQAQVNAQISQLLGRRSEAAMAWATAPAEALLMPRYQLSEPDDMPCPGLCLALAGKGGSRLCLRPLWQTDGKERLACMQHIIKHAPVHHFLEQAAKHHVANWMASKRGAACIPASAGDAFISSTRFNQLMQQVEPPAQAQQ